MCCILFNSLICRNRTFPPTSKRLVTVVRTSCLLTGRNRWADPGVIEGGHLPWSEELTLLGATARLAGKKTRPRNKQETASFLTVKCFWGCPGESHCTLIWGIELHLVIPSLFSGTTKSKSLFSTKLRTFPSASVVGYSVFNAAYQLLACLNTKLRC